MHPRISALRSLGQSLWYDNMRRSFLKPGGELHSLIADGTVVGVTSNPSIFQKAIASSSDYDEAFAALVAKGATAGQIYLALVEEDIRTTADLLLPIYEESDAVDGYVSIEVSPHLAHDTEGTIREGLELVSLLDRPNVMIKVPGTPEGVPAIQELTRRGVSVNVTLLFSLSQYEAIANAYLEGLEARVQAGHGIAHQASVASFFVSRVDTLIDKRLLDEHPHEEKALHGKAAIANAKLAYARGNSLFAGPRWQALAQHGANAQRLLWASTSTKDPRLPDTLYMDELIGANTVNTLPPPTIFAFLDHGNPTPALQSGLNQARDQIAALEDLGIDLEEVGAVLQKDGVKSFADAMDGMMKVISQRLAAARGA